jgi:hypothetical protein
VHFSGFVTICKESSKMKVQDKEDKRIKAIVKALKNNDDGETSEDESKILE